MSQRPSRRAPPPFSQRAATVATTTTTSPPPPSPPPARGAADPQAGEGDDGTTCLALFGHAVFLNAIAFALALSAGADAPTQDALLDMDLGETQGILVEASSTPTKLV